MSSAFYRIIFSAIIITVVSCKQPVKIEFDTARFQTMLDDYWRGLMKLQPLDAMQFGDNSVNDQFRNTCTQAYRKELKDFYLAFQDSLKNFNSNDMSEEDALSYKVLQFDVVLQLEKTKYDTWKIPFTQMGDATNTLSGNIVLAMG